MLGASRRQGIQPELRRRQVPKSKLDDRRRCCRKSKTGTTIRFWPDPKYFDTDKFAIPSLKQVLRAKAVLCPKLRVTLVNEGTGERDEWYYTGGLHQYLAEELGKGEWLPAETFYGKRDIDGGGLDWAFAWVLEAEHRITESYVNLIPTVEGGTHVNGLRAGAADAVREFCEFRNLVPRGLKLAPEDVWDGVSFVLSMKMREPQFAGQTKERLSSRESAAIVQGVIKDAFAHVAQSAFGSGREDRDAGHRQCAAAVQGQPERSRASASSPVRHCRAKLADCVSQDPKRGELFLVEGDSAGGSAKQARDRVTQAIMPLRGKILNTWEADTREVLQSQEVHNISIAIGVEPASRPTCPDCGITRSAFSRTPTATGSTSRRCCARCSCAIIGRWWPPGMSMSACRRCSASMRARRWCMRSTRRNARRRSSASPRRIHGQRRWLRASRASAR